MSNVYAVGFIYIDLIYDMIYIMYFSNRFGVFPTFFPFGPRFPNKEEFPGHFMASSGSLSSLGR